MIPFFEANILVLGPITIQVWGFFVAVGIISGVLLSRHLAKKVFLSPEVVSDFGVWGIIGGIIGARFVHVFLYEPKYYLDNPLEILFLWQGGVSSLGGFLGAAIAILLFAKKRGFNLKELLPYFDIMSLGLWLGWAIGRVGCFFIHDHIGRLSNFFLAVDFPAGARFDLGLLESLLAFLVFVVFIFSWKKIIKNGWGKVFIYSFLAFALFRFGLDFLRAEDIEFSDPRYFFLTPMQWGIVCGVVGLTIWKIYSRISARNS